ncbi:MAG TPA: glycosyltransferase family 4 protein, partial [Solirubrobacteraceae bacterium]|nr:glycosyltransferase family 4 protein [Solirubrobacteraceae bacterium]
RQLVRFGLRVALVAHRLPEGLPAEVDGVVIVGRPAYDPHGPLTGKIKEAVRIWRTLHRANAAVIVKRAYGVDAGIVALYARATRRRFVYSSASVIDFDVDEVLLKRRDRTLFHLGLRLANDIVVQTEEQLPLCERRVGRPAVLIKSIAEEAPARAREPNSFLWIGRIISYKQPLAFVRLARDRPDARLVMVGVPSPHSERGRTLYKAVEQASRELPNLELLEPRPRAELAPLIDEAVAVVNTADYEGMPNVLLEGWARGVPALVLTHDPGGVVERHGLGGFAGGSMARLTQLAEEMWRTRHDQAEVSKRCRTYLRREHAPESVAMQWYEIVASDRRPAGPTRQTCRMTDSMTSVTEPKPGLQSSPSVETRQ